MVAFLGENSPRIVALTSGDTQAIYSPRSRDVLFCFVYQESRNAALPPTVHWGKAVGLRLALIIHLGVITGAAQQGCLMDV